MLYTIAQRFWLNGSLNHAFSALRRWQDHCATSVMKHSFTLLALLVVSIALVSCKKTDEILDSFTHFTFGADYVVGVPAAPASNMPVTIVTPEIATHSNEAFSANKTRADMVEEINLSKLQLTVKTPDGGTLKFLKSVDIYARAEGLPDVRVAYKDQVPDDVGAVLDLDVTGAELREYFKKDKYFLRITVTTDQATTVNYAVNAHSDFFVNAKLLD